MALNRATLARQLLLERDDCGPLEAVQRLVGLQAQVPGDPYVALWSRLRGFGPEDLATLVVERAVVRLPLMRATIHLVTADDCLAIRPLVQPVLDKELARHPQHRPQLAGLDLAPVLAWARQALGARSFTGPALRDALREQFPQYDPSSLAYACRNHLALVQVPPRGVWGRSAQPELMTAEGWLGRPLAAISIDELIVRYLTAFGPATPADAAAWSRLTGLREVFERLRPRLRTFRDEGGRELFDVPDGPRPDADQPAPARFLPEYDNVLLSHHDRSRFLPGVAVGPLFDPANQVRGSLLVDGLLRGSWRLEQGRGDARATLHVFHAGRLPPRDRAPVEREGGALADLLVDRGVTVDVGFQAVN